MLKLQRTPEKFPIKKTTNFMAYCSVSPLYGPASDRAIKCLKMQSEMGLGMIFEYMGEDHIANRFKKNFAALMKTEADNITMTTNTSEAISMIANGYPFEPGDQVISYVNEYPANHYPWVVQQKRRGIELVLLGDVPFEQTDEDGVADVPDSFARSWSFEELESAITDRTRIIAISHVQFTSGFAADLERLGALCKEKDIDLVVDAAQSLGCLPVYPEEWNISAVAAAGWKWLLGPVGAGVMYTSQEFRDKIEITMSGADQMKQETQYLDHTWDPHTTGQKFEYSTVTYSALDALSICVEELFVPNSAEDVRDNNFDLQDLALEKLNLSKYQPIRHVGVARSGILSLIPKNGDAKEISAKLAEQNIRITPRDGYLRFAPHLCTTQQEVVEAVNGLNEVG